MMCGTKIPFELPAVSAPINVEPPIVVLQTSTPRTFENSFIFFVVNPGGTMANFSLQKQYTPMLGLPKTSANITAMRGLPSKPDSQMDYAALAGYTITFPSLSLTARTFILLGGLFMLRAQSNSLTSLLMETSSALI